MVIALLHPGNIYESYWGMIFWKECGVDNTAPGFDMRQFSRDFIMPRITRIMDSKEKKLC